MDDGISTMRSVQPQCEVRECEGLQEGSSRARDKVARHPLEGSRFKKGSECKTLFPVARPLHDSDSPDLEGKPKDDRHRYWAFVSCRFAVLPASTASLQGTAARL